MFLMVFTPLAYAWKKILGLDDLMAPSYAYVLLYQSLYTLQFALASLALKVRFQLINENIRYTFSLNSQKNTYLNDSFTIFSSFSFDSHFISKKIAVVPVCRSDLEIPSLLQNLYHQLCDGIALVNSSFTSQLIPLMVYFLSTTTFVGYTALREFSFPTDMFMFQVYLNGLWLVVQYMVKFVLVYSGSSTTNQAQETSVIIIKVINNLNTSRHQRKIFKNFMSQIAFRNLHLQNVMFKINWHFLLAVSSIYAFSVAQ